MSRRFSPSLLPTSCQTGLTKEQQLGPMVPLLDFSNHKPHMKIEWHTGIIVFGGGGRELRDERRDFFDFENFDAAKN